MSLPNEVIANIVKDNENSYSISKDISNALPIKFIRYEELDYHKHLNKVNILYQNCIYFNINPKIDDYNLVQKTNKMTMRKNYIEFDDSFNENLDILVNYKLKVIKFGFIFNKSVDNLPDCINTIIFGEAFNTEIHNFPILLKKIYFGYSFNQDLNLPKGITTLHLGNNFNKNIKNLQSNLISFGINYYTLNLTKNQKSLKTLKITSYFDEINNIYIPDSVTELLLVCKSGFDIPNHINKVYSGYIKNDVLDLPESITHMNNCKMKILPVNLVEVEFNHYFNSEILFFPETLKKIKFGYKYDFPLDNLPESLEHLEFGDNFNSSLSLPNNLSYLKLGFNFNKKLVLPIYLEYLEFGYCFNKKIKFSKNIKTLIFGNLYNQELFLPPFINKLKLGTFFDNKITFTNPENMKHLEINFDSIINLPINEMNLDELITIHCYDKYEQNLNSGILSLSGMKKIKLEIIGTIYRLYMNNISSLYK